MICAMVSLYRLVFVGLALSSFLGSIPHASAQDSVGQTNGSCLGICQVIRSLLGQSSPAPIGPQAALNSPAQPHLAAAASAARQPPSAKAVAPRSLSQSRITPSSRAPAVRGTMARPRGVRPGGITAGRVRILGPRHGDPDRQLAEEIAKASQRPFRFVPRVTGRNVAEQMLQAPDADFAVISTAAVADVSGQNEGGAGLTYVAKLFPQELHLLARPEVRSIEDLDGKAVAIGGPGSTSARVARDIFAALAIKPREIALDADAGLARVRSGDLSAAVVVAGKPSAKLASIGSANGLRLLPVQFAPALQATYLPATIAPADYPGLVREGAPVETIAVGMVLVARNTPEGSGRSFSTAAFVERFFSNLPKLVASGHPKWREVNIAAVTHEAPRFGAARRWLEARMPDTGQPRTTSSIRTRLGASP
jgi:uncharacterized protein